jgi:hypothetical protein
MWAARRSWVLGPRLPTESVRLLGDLFSAAAFWISRHFHAFYYPSPQSCLVILGKEQMRRRPIDSAEIAWYLFYWILPQGRRPPRSGDESRPRIKIFILMLIL